MTASIISVQEPAAGDTQSAQGVPLREYPNWDSAAQALLWRCGPAGMTLKDALDDECPDEASLQRWMESFSVPEELTGLEQQFTDRENPEG